MKLVEKSHLILSLDFVGTQVKELELKRAESKIKILEKKVSDGDRGNPDKAQYAEVM